MGFTQRQGHVLLSSPGSSVAESDALILVVAAEASSCSNFQKAHPHQLLLYVFLHMMALKVHAYPLAKATTFSRNHPPFSQVLVSISSAG